MPCSPKSPIDYLPKFVGNPLHAFAETNIQEISSIVEGMHNVGGGFDKINTKIFKATYRSIIVELVHFMNLCLQQGIFPRLLKIAVIKPIYKSGDRQLFNNYRPISLLPVISKLLEKLIYCRLNEHLESNNIFNAF